MKKRIKELYEKIPNWCKNGYFISSFLFLIWISFFDTNSILAHLEKKNQIKNLEIDIEYYQGEIEKDEIIIEILSQDSLTPKLEKYFREELFLSKKNEEIFIIE